MRAGANAEWHPLRHVMVHEPGIEVFFALLAPTAHLYERFFSLNEARLEHRQLCDLLETTFGVRVNHLGPVIQGQSRYREQVFEALSSIATHHLHKVCPDDAGALPPKIREELEQPLDLSSRDPEHLFNIVTLDPMLVMNPFGVRVALGNPLYNLYFMRDQQVCTDKGMVLGRMAKKEREGEIEVTGLALKALDTPPISRIRDGFLEGGDFLPADEFALIGSGSRSNMTGIQELLRHSVGYDEIAVVRQPQHPLISGIDPMVSMHLDTYFNIGADGVAVGNPLLLREAKVECFEKSGTGYTSSGKVTTLDHYIREKGFEIIDITTLEQLCYATNFLCIRDGECIAPDTNKLSAVIIRRLKERTARNPQKYGALLQQAEHDRHVLRTSAEFFPNKQEVFSHGIDMTPLILTNATGGYGGAHCMTCVLQRR